MERGVDGFSFGYPALRAKDYKKIRSGVDSLAKSILHYEKASALARKPRLSPSVIKSEVGCR